MAIPESLRRWLPNGKAAFYARRILLYGAALAVLGTGWAQLSGRIVAPVLAAVAAEREARIHADTLLAGVLRQVLDGQEVIIATASEGLYTKAQINRMRVLADQEHNRLDGQIDRVVTRLDNLERRRR